MTTLRPLALTLSLLGAGLALVPADARACGGCFAPPGAAQVVTDHRMVLSLSTTKTTLWDQFQYSGNPQEFSWILPIRYTDSTLVQLASNDFMRLLDNVMLPALQQPNPPGYAPDCMPPYSLDDSDRTTLAGAAAPEAADAGVTVLREQVVGPYNIAIVRGTTGMGIRDWLRMNGYSVPASMEPVLDYYLSLNMDFIALRLRAGAGVNRMLPVRVTVDGYQARLPLRMIGAGVADRVGLALTVIAPSRIEATNFPNATFTDDDFTYDWSAPPVDLATAFLSTFNARNHAMGDRLWLTESSMPQQQSNLSSLASRLPPADPSMGTGMMAISSPVDDVRVAFDGLGETATVTRMRADVTAAALDQDLELRASDAGTRDRFYRFGHELHRPAYLACPWNNQTSYAGIQCSTSRTSSRNDNLGYALVAGLALATVAARRRR